MGVNYLTKEIEYATCTVCGAKSVAVDFYDEYDSVTQCPKCHAYNCVEDTTTEPAKQWTVALYETGRAYGGPEEGGWWYDYGTLTEQEKMRTFTSFDEAVAYQEKLWEEVDAHSLLPENRYADYRLTVWGYTDTEAYTHYPKTRPYYC